MPIDKSGMERREDGSTGRLHSHENQEGRRVKVKAKAGSRLERRGTIFRKRKSMPGEGDERR